MVNWKSKYLEMKLKYINTKQSAGMNLEQAYKKSKLGAAALLTGTGTVMLYHGQEFGQNSMVSLDPQPLQWENLNSDLGQSLFNHYLIRFILIFNSILYTLY